MSWIDDIFNASDEAAQQQSAQQEMAAADENRLTNENGQILAEGSPDGQVGAMGPDSGPWGNAGVQRLENGWYVTVYQDDRPPRLFNASGQPVQTLNQEQMEMFRSLGENVANVRFNPQTRTFMGQSNGSWTTITPQNVGQFNGSGGGGSRPGSTPTAPGTSAPPGGGGGGTHSSGGSWGPAPNPNQGGTTPPIGGAPGSGQTNPALDWNTPIGSIQNPGGGSIGSLPGLNPGGGINVPSIWDIVGNNPTLGQVAGGVDEINRRLLQGQLDISSGMFAGYNNDPNVQANRGLVGQMLANPYSINDQTYNQMRGQITDRANQQGNNLADYARQRSASMGTGRDEGERQAMSAYRSAANQAAEGTRQLDVQRAVQNAQDIRSAIQTGGRQTSQDWQHQQAIAGGALGSLGNAQFSGDAFLQSALAAAGAQAQQNGNRAPQIQYNYTPPSFLGGFAG